MKYNLSVIIPSIRVQNLSKIYFMLEKAIEPYDFELIVVGPYQIPETLYNKENVKYIKDFGCPSRCVQLASTMVEGKYLCWMSDDCTYLTPQGLSQCINILEKSNENDAICLRYFEGDGNNEFAYEYWNAEYHGHQKDLLGIKGKNYKLAPLGMYNTEYFREIGGLDCRYQHINLCTHDLAFRLQNNGGKIHLSPQTVARFYWSWITADAGPVQKAWFENDESFFRTMYNKDQSNRIKINYWNWTEVESKWSMRFG